MYLNKKYLFLPFRIILASFRHVKKMIFLLNIHKFNSLTVLLKILYINIFYMIPRIRNFRNKISIDKVNSDKSLDPKTKKNIFELSKKGCTEVNTLRKLDVDKILKEIFLYNKKNIIFRRRKTNFNLIIKDNETINNYNKRIFEEKISRFIIPINLDKSHFIKKMILSKINVETAKIYLKSDNFSIGASCHISNALKIDDDEKLGNAQLYHFDNDFSNFLKMYIYLTDVGTEDGPHTYIENTHKNKNVDHFLIKRNTDKEIEDSYPSKKIYTGIKGTYFLTDGFGIHKGEIVKRNYRMILNVHYGLEKIKYYKYDTYVKSSQFFE